MPQDKEHINPVKKSTPKFPFKTLLWVLKPVLILAIIIAVYYPYRKGSGDSNSSGGNTFTTDSAKEDKISPGQVPPTLPTEAPKPGPGPAKTDHSPPLNDSSFPADPQSEPPISKTDTTKKPANIDLQERSAVLGYSFFRNMRQDETRSINAYVKIINDSSVVISRLKTIASEDIPVRANDTASIYTENILLYKYLSINLIDGDSDFTIKPIHVKSRQKIDTARGNIWTWAITPKTSKKHGRLILQVIAEDASGEIDPLESRNITIDISLDRTLLRRLWTFINEHPLETLTLILIPVIAFFGKNLLFRKKNKNEAWQVLMGALQIVAGRWRHQPGKPNEAWQVLMGALQIVAAPQFPISTHN